MDGASPRIRFKTRSLTSYLALALGLALTLVARMAVQRSVDAVRARRFEAAAEDITAAIGQRMDAYLALLRGTRSLFELGVPITRERFRAYVEGLELEAHYPGIQGIGFAEAIPRESLAAHLAAVRAEGFPDYRVWPEGDRPLYTSIVLLEPFDARNRRAFGYDMFTDPTRRAAMERARETGAPAASARVTLVQEGGGERQPGFLIYLPLFVPGGVPWAHGPLRGFIYSPFRAEDLLRGIFREPNRSRVDFALFDGEGTDPGQLLYGSSGASPAEAGAHVPALRQTRSLTVAGRRWTLLFTARAGFESDASRYAPFLTLGLGALISVLLFVLTQEQLQARAVAEESGQRATFLAEAGTVLSSSLDTDTTLEHIARLCVPGLADWCLVEMREEDGSIRTVAAAHCDPAEERWAREYRRRYPPDPRASGGLARVLRTGVPELTPVVTEEMLLGAGRDPEQQAMIHRARIRSFMCVPLVMRGGTMGAIVFISGTPGRYGQGDLALARELAAMAASAVDNARLYQEAQQAIRLREEFLSIAAHELKTPLTSMQLNVQLLRRQLPAEVRERLGRSTELLGRQTERLGKLINQLLDVSRAVHGRLALDLEEVDLAALTREVAEGAREDLAAAHSPLRLEAEGPVTGQWDRLRLEQVLTNLLSNAIKYGAGKPIALKVTGDGRGARVTVTDQGIGIPPEDLERVFGRFERGVSSRHYGGLGLGLYISRRIVEALGGTLRAESRPGEGSTFTVELPREAPMGAPAGGEGTGGNERGVPADDVVK